MKHEFTEDDLKQALRHTAYMDDGLRINIPAWVEDNDEVDTEQVDVFRAILDALPEPEPVADEWEECTLDQIRKGDRVKVVQDTKETIYKNSVIHVYNDPEGKHIRTSNYHVADEVTEDMILYRIPAPVQHPDPEQHPVIMGVVTRHGSNHDFGVRNWSNYHVYSDGQSEGFLNSDQITDWEPAKIVRIEEK